jgi:predicted amidophosphoribosyltransferase
MIEPRAICPQCQKAVQFTTVTGFRRCPECGFQYPISEPPPLLEVRPASEGIRNLFKYLFYVILIMAALVVVGIAVLFAGCALVLGGSHF